LPGKAEENHRETSIRVASLPARIHIWNLQNTKQGANHSIATVSFKQYQIHREDGITHDKVNEEGQEE
jgi:hypothetical protein